LVFSFGEEKAFLLWHVGGIGRFSLSWAHSPLVAACIFGVGRVSLPQVVCSSFVEWESPLKGLLVDYLVAVCLPFG
jgi:hypothetical protein